MPTTVKLLIPVYEDSASARLLVEALDAEAARLPWRLSVLFVDDGSTPAEADALPGPTAAIPEIDVLRLRRNLGHQRAIAIGLAAIAAGPRPDIVVVMDGDGEDTPASLGPLVAEAVSRAGSAVVFARRLKRHDGIGFLAGYHGFRLLHRLLVGTDIAIGNFSAVPAALLDRVVGIAEIWNHYAAGVVHARIPVRLVPIERGRRLAGRSKMNLPALVMHGICALSVWSDLIVARLLLVGAAVMGATLVGLAAAACGAVVGMPRLPGWTPGFAGLLVLVVLLLGVICLLLALFMLGSRSGTTFLPHRDWRDHVLPPAAGRDQSPSPGADPDRGGSGTITTSRR